MQNSKQLINILSSFLFAVLMIGVFNYLFIHSPQNHTVYAATCTGSGDVTGQVFRDFNSDGNIDPRELGIYSVTVSAYDSNGALVASCETDHTGLYTLTVGADFPVRVEVTNYPTYLYPTSEGTDFPTTVAFLTAGASNQNFGLHAPDDYCQTNPDVATSCFVNGDPLLGGTAGTLDVFVSFPYTSTGGYGDAGHNMPDHLAFGSQMGSVWGVSYQRQSDTTFASAMTKRHSGFGPLGTGGIYAVDMQTGVTSQYLDLNSIAGINTGADMHTGLSGDASTQNHDPAAFDAVGRVSLGDIDISGDDTLWVVNLFDSTLYRIENVDPATPPTASDITGFPIPDPGCSNSEYRPWAVKAHNGQVHVGVVCTAETSQLATDLEAYIIAIDSENPTTFSTVFTFGLDYPRAYASVQGANQLHAEWRPWIDEWADITNPAPGTGPYGQTGYPQPVLSDLEFDDEGNIIVGLMDRMGHQTGDNNYSTILTDTTLYDGISAGDILLVCNIQGSYELEGDGICSDDPEAATRGVITNRTDGRRTIPEQGPGRAYGGNTDFGEHFWQDMHQLKTNPADRDERDGIHQEVTIGGLAYTPIHEEVLVTAFDPVDQVRTGGVRWFDTREGTSPQQYEVFDVSAGTNPQNFGKAAGLGDLELLCLASPIEVGNRIWFDFDGDGIQDPDEDPIANVVVGLYDDGGVLIATATTDANGNYLFSNAFGTSSASRIYGLNQLDLKSDYTIGILDSNFSGGALDGFVPTTANVNSGTNSDIRDSDISVVSVGSGVSSASVGVDITTNRAGENNHSYDAGFYRPEGGDLPEGTGICGTPTYPTTYSNSGPIHSLYPDTNGDDQPDDANAIWLGTIVDADSDGSPNSGAAGDDGNDVDDEDGVQNTPAVNWANGAGGASIDVTVSGGAGWLVGWLDFDCDGTFDSFVSQAVSVGSSTILMDVPANTFDPITTITVYGRFRLFESEAQANAVAGGTADINNGFTGFATNGEVEDYVWQFSSPTAVTLQSTQSQSGVSMALLILLTVMILAMGVFVWQYRRRLTA